MSLEEADTIRDAWGKFLEVSNHQLLSLFGGYIPESLLPYPKAKIIEAMSIYIDHLMQDDDEQTAHIAESSLGFLQAFTDDKLAIRMANVRLNPRPQKHI
jgi:hypothetical protein